MAKRHRSKRAKVAAEFRRMDPATQQRYLKLNADDNHTKVSMGIISLLITIATVIGSVLIS